MKKPTDKQIDTEIKTLQAIKPKVPARTFFGDSNHEKIDAQIRVLQERMDEGDVYDSFEDDENPDSTYDILSSALDCCRWINGEEKDAPSKGWKPIAKK